MKCMRTTLVLAGLLAGSLAGASTELRADGPHQCYRRVNEPLDACSMCMGTCFGDGYMCCTIIVG